MKSYIQQNSVQQYLADHRFSYLKSALSLLLAFLSACFPLQASADTAINDRFELYVNNVCNTPPLGADLTKLTALCFVAFAGGPAGGGAGSTSSSSNLGTADAASGIISPKNIESHECLDDFKKSQERRGVLLADGDCCFQPSSAAALALKLNWKTAFNPTCEV